MKSKFEDFRLPVLNIFFVALGLVILIITVSFFLSLWQRNLSSTSPSEKGPFLSPRQQLEFDSGILAREARTHQQKELEAYSWKDAQKNFAEVPIERAMEALETEAGK